MEFLHTSVNKEFKQRLVKEQEKEGYNSLAAFLVHLFNYYMEHKDINNILLDAPWVEKNIK